MKAYGDLGIKIDETTGKLTGVDSAMIKKAEKDKSRRIKEMEAELREIQNENQQQADLRDKAGIPVWFGGKEMCARHLAKSGEMLWIF